MNYFSKNLKRLRSIHKLSQASIAGVLKVSRTNIAKYEGGVHEPSIDVLMKIAKNFGVTLDALITLDFSSLSDEYLLNFEEKSIRLLPIQVDTDGKNLIEVVPHDAQAGYSGMYADPGFIESLDNLKLPQLITSKKCRAFPINGDSMPPYGDGSFAVGEYIDNRSMIKEGERYIVLTKDDGIVFKRVLFVDNNEIQLFSDNPNYKPFKMLWIDVIEVWRFRAGITINNSENNTSIHHIVEKVERFRKELDIFSKNYSIKK
tara:strand:- start:1591 stop:2370 length:780 start_codon:yes stop_codon:yes gene_type:complete